MKTRIKWPKTVPRIYPSMCCKNVIASGEKRCAVGWTIEIFRSDLRAGRDARGVLEKIIKSCNIAEWNDSPQTTLADIAAALNKLTDKLGYTEYVNQD